MQKMFNLDVLTNENNMSDHSYRILIIGGSASGKTNTLLNLISEQDNNELIDKIFLYVRDLNEPKYKLLIKQREALEICLNEQNPKSIVEYSNNMADVYNNINDCNPKRKKKINCFC